MEDGRLVEQGTHSELLERHGVYARLWHKQNAFTVDAAHGRARVDVSWLREIPILAGLGEERLEEIAGRFSPAGFLEDHQPVDQVFGSRRAAGHVDVHGQDLVDPLQDRVVVEDARARRAGPH